MWDYYSINQSLESCCVLCKWLIWDVIQMEAKQHGLWVWEGTIVGEGWMLEAALLIPGLDTVLIFPVMGWNGDPPLGTQTRGDPWTPPFDLS